MALIAAQKTTVKEKIKLDIDKEIYSDIQKYCVWSGISEMDHFFEEAASYILSKDKDWKKHQRSVGRVNSLDSLV